MNNNIRILTLIMLSLSNISYAADNRLDNKQIFELKTACGKSAFEYYARNKLCNGHGNYINHYNVKLNSCFIHMMASCKADNDSDMFWAESLIEVNENREFGSYIGDRKLVDGKPAMCHVENKQCKNLEEFKELIKPYMSE
jgi:hypothetical protein